MEDSTHPASNGPNQKFIVLAALYIGGVGSELLLEIIFGREVLQHVVRATVGKSSKAPSVALGVDGGFPFVEFWF